MILAVKFYKDCPNPNEMPPGWPAECIELKDGKECPDGWAEMTVKEYEDLRARRWPEYQAWEKNVERPRKKLIEKKLAQRDKLAPMAEAIEALEEDGERLDKAQRAILNKYIEVKAALEELGSL